MSLEVEVLRSDAGTPIGLVTSVCMSCNASYRLYGGNETATLTFDGKYNESPVLDAGDFIRVSRDGVPLFAGRVLICKPDFRSTIHTVDVNGWWVRLAEREAVTPALLDHIMFGQHPDSNYPLIKTAYDVMLWIVNNRVINDPDAMINVGRVERPQYPCKLSGPFYLYAKDNLQDVLETLATMEDCLTGIDSEGNFYFFPRSYAEGVQLTSVYVEKSVPYDWMSQGIGIVESGTFVYDKRGPNAVAVHSRDKMDRQAIRSYHLENALPASTVKTIPIRASNLHTGVQSRRYARGLFRRFSDYSLKIDNLTFVSGSRQLEPHLGKIKVEGVLPDDSPYVFADKLAGQVSIDINRTTFTGSVALGENAVDPGSENPMTDPDSETQGFSDMPQVDTGLGQDGYPLASAGIDLEDGWDGDGDDLHQNPDREFWEDPPGVGVDGVDYGTDTGAGRGDEGGGGDAWGATLLGEVISNANYPEYDVLLYSPDGQTSGETLSDVPVWPPDVPRLQVGQKVLVNRTSEEDYWVDGAIQGRGLKLRIGAVRPANRYQVELLDIANEAIVLATFDNVLPYPINSTFGEGDKVFGYWFSGDATPTPVGSGGCCGGYFQGFDDLGFAGQTITD